MADGEHFTDDDELEDFRLPSIEQCLNDRLPTFGDMDFHIDIPWTATRWHVRDNGNGTTTIAMSQDCTEILDDNQRMAGESGISRDKTFFRIGRVPLVLLEDWKNMGIDHRDQEGAKKIIKMMASNEFYKLRTSKEKL